MTRLSNQPMPHRALALAIGLALALPAAAQVPATPAAGANRPVSDAATLDAITVTATRRPEDARAVPISVSVVDGPRLDVARSGGEDIRFLSARVPSLNIESSFGRTFPRFYIRGLGNNDFDLNSSQPVSLVYDEVVLENSVLKGFPAFDLETIEVLRGPQGTLFGRNTPAGVVKFESVRPGRELDGYGRVSFARFGTINAEGAVGDALGETLAGRVSALYQRRDDWVDNLAPGQPANRGLEGYEDRALRAQLLWEPSADFSALLALQSRRLDGTARLFRANALARDGSGLVPGFDPESVSVDGLNEQTLDVDGMSLRASWNLGDVTLHSVTGHFVADTFSRGDIDGGSSYTFDFATATNPGSYPALARFPSETGDGADIRQSSQELRLVSNRAAALNWQAGVFWFEDRIEIDTFNYAVPGSRNPADINGRVAQRQDNQAWALFGSVDWAASDRLLLRAGLRYTEDEKDFVAERFSSPIGAGALAPVRRDPSASHWSWDASATWVLTDEVNVYGRVASGFRAPAIQGRILFGNDVSVAEAETILSFESGIKARLFDNRARLGFTLYQYVVEDRQLTAVGGGVNFNRLVNADEVLGRGFELDLEAYLSDELLVTFGSSYNHTEIDDPTLAVAPCFNPAVCRVTDPLITVGGRTLALIDGNPLPQAPEWIHNFTARYAVPLGESGEFFVLTDWAYRGQVHFFLYESAVFRGAAVLEGGLRLGYNWSFGNYEIAVYGRNITNEIEAVGGIDFNNLTGFINEPRIWGLEFRAGF